MFHLTGDGYVRITGRDGVYQIPDMAARAQKRAAKVVGPHILESVTATWAVPKVPMRLAEVLARDSAYRRECLAARHEKLAVALGSERLGSKIPTALGWISGVKPGRVSEMVQEHAIPCVQALRRCFDESMADIIAGRLVVARRMLKDAMAPETPKNAAQASVQALRAMETRSRVAALPEIERIKLVSDLGEKGQLAVLSWLQDDPLGVSVVPGDVMKNAVHTAIEVNDGHFLLAACEDAEEEVRDMGLACDLMFDGVIGAFVDAGAPDLRERGGYLAAANNAIANQ